MPLTAKGVVLLAPPAVAGVAVALAQIPAPDTVWPTSVAGWIALVLAVFAILGYAHNAWKSSQAPVDRKLKAAKDEATAEQNLFHRTVSAELNGFGGRLEKVERSSSAATTDVTVLQREFAVSQRDNANLAGSIQRVEHQVTKALEENKEERRAFERRIEALIERALAHRPHGGHHPHPRDG